MAVADGCGMLAYREMGLVSQVFDEATLAPRQGRPAIGRTRDSVTGGGANPQRTFKPNVAGGGIVVAHDGSLTTTAGLAGATVSTPVAGGGRRPHRGPLEPLSELAVLSDLVSTGGCA